MAGKPTRTEITITGTQKQTQNRVEKKFYKSIRIPTGDDFYVQASIWVPNTPGYSKLPKIVITLNNHREKLQILFPSAIDMMEFCDILQRFANHELKEINTAHTDATKEYQMFREVLEEVAGKRTQQKAEEKFSQQTGQESTAKNEEIAPF